MAEAGFTRGVFEEVLAAPVPLAISLLGVGAWAGWLVRARLTPTTFELAMLLTVTAQLVLVRIPDVQYVAPVFIWCAVFLPYCGLWTRELTSRWSPAPAAATAAAAALAICAASLALTTSWGSGAAGRFADVQRGAGARAAGRPHRGTSALPPHGATRRALRSDPDLAAVGPHHRTGVWALSTQFGATFRDGDVNTGDPEPGANMSFDRILPIPIHGEGKDAWQIGFNPTVTYDHNASSGSP